MKALLLLSVILFSYTAYSFEKESMMSYRIDSVKTARDIAKDQTAYTFGMQEYGVIEAKKVYRIIYSYGKGNRSATIKNGEKMDLILPKGKYTFSFYLSDQYFEIHTDSIYGPEQKRTFISLIWERSDQQIMVEKPVIYLYPIEPTLVTVKVHPTGEMLFTYPPYNEEWHVTAHPNGSLENSGKTYNYLFWESTQDYKTLTQSFEEGFYVSNTNVSIFLENILAQAGFTSQETADFITFWGPKMAMNKMNEVHFIFNEKCDQFANLEISPQPDHIYRFYMLYKPVSDDHKIVLREQIIPKMQRDGFVVLEWGGSEIPQHLTN